MWQPRGEAPALHLNGGSVPRGEDVPLGYHGGSEGLDGQGAGQEVALPEGRSQEDAAAVVAGGDFPTPSVSAALLISQV